MQGKKLVLTIVGATVLGPHALAVNNSEPQKACDQANGGITISAKDQNGKSVEYAYTKDRVLHHAQIGAVGITYTYSRSNLLVYATTDTGTVYTVSRDRENRILKIVGSNSTVMNVTYSSESNVPSTLSIVTAKGESVAPVILQTSGNLAKANDYPIQAIDQSLTSVYEAYAYPE